MKYLLIALMLISFGCKTMQPVTVDKCKVPCLLGDKQLKYTYAAYVNSKGKLTFAVYVTDSTYSADAKKYFEVLKNGVKIQ